MTGSREWHPALHRRTPEREGRLQDTHAWPMRRRMVSCLLLHHAHTHLFSCPYLSPGCTTYFLGSGPKPTFWTLAHTPQREATDRPAGHNRNLLSLQGQPRSFAISSDPGRGWRRQQWWWDTAMDLESEDLAMSPYLATY